MLLRERVGRAAEGAGEGAAEGTGEGTGEGAGEGTAVCSERPEGPADSFTAYSLLVI